MNFIFFTQNNYLPLHLKFKKKILSIMKNILLFAFVLGLLIETHAQSRMYIGNAGTVYVSPNTLLYSKGGIKAVSDGTLKSQGNVKLDDKLENEGDGSNIVFDYEIGKGEDSAYGQLQISDGTTGSNNKITMVTNALEAQGSSEKFPVIAFPFTTGTDLVSALENSSLTKVLKGYIEAKDVSKVYTNQAYNDYRYFNYAWYLDNDGHKIINAEKELLQPYLSYTLNLQNNKSHQAFSGIDKKNFKISGVPFYKNISVDLKPSLADIDFTTDAGKKSVYYIKTPYANLAHRYVDATSDFIDATSDNTWGHNLYELGNPYTQNIDLFKVLTASGLTPTMVKGIAIRGSSNLGNPVKDQLYENYISNYNKITCTSGASFSLSTCTSTNRFSLIRPFGIFDLKLNPSAFTGGVRSIKFDDSSKTFAYTGLGVYDEKDKTVGTQDRSSRQADSKAIEELTLSLKEGYITKARVALSANPWANTEVDKQLDAIAGDGRINGESKDIPLYLLNEKDNVGDSKLSINGFNMSTYRGKSLKIVLSTVPGQSYTLAGSVRIAEESNLPYTHFFIEDKQQNKIIRIGSDFSYSFSASENDSNRFVAYYAKVPVDVDQKQVEEVKSLIDIARNSEGESVIVFKGQTGKAKIYVYNILGQLIFSDKDVDTSANYSLHRLPQGGVYLVKVINSEGKVINKKIIK